MATKTFYLDWMGQYKASTNSYYGGGSPIRVGSTSDYQSYCGFPSSVRDALKTSKTSTTLKIQLYVTEGAEFDVGAHKETYNKASGTMPWYTYIGLAPRLGDNNGQGQWHTIDLTDAFMNDYEAGTYHGIVLYGATSDYGVASNTGSTRVKILVTGDWNDPPNTPTITYPDGGEVVDTSITLKWTGSDPDGDSLKYTLAYKEGDGSSWQYISTGYGVTQYTFDTSNWAEGSNAQFAVKASDGQEWSPYTYSNKFTIDHNQPPSKPTQLEPANGAIVDRTDIIRFSWKHNDDGEQAGYRLAWRTVASDGTLGAWNYIPDSTNFQNTTNQYYNMPANTLPNSTIDWTVQTKDQQGEQSEYANYIRIEAREPTNAPTILSPANLSEISTTRVTVEWSSLNQLEYELILYDTNGLTIWSEINASSIKLREIPVDLDNNKWYEIHLRVKDSVNQIWSEYTVHSFGTSFNPPMVPLIKKSEEAGDGVLNIFYSAGEGNLLPELLVGGTGEGETPEPNPLIQPYSGTLPEDYTITGDESFDLVNKTLIGIELILTADEIPLVEGATYTMYGNVDLQGSRWLLQALDDADTSLGISASSPDAVNSPTGYYEQALTLPVGTTKLMVRWHTTWDNANPLSFSDVGLKAEVSGSTTTKIQVFRREFTPTGVAPWIMIADNLGLEGSFLDFTPASGTLYEYKVRAVNETNQTSSDSGIKQIQIDFEETFIQESSNLSSIILLTYATSREAEVGIDSKIQHFAGRRDPVREFGENETLEITVEWEVDTYTDVKFVRDMVRRRDILLYRDGWGRRYWVTTDKVSAQDKPIRGYVLSASFTVTSYEEDVSKQNEEGLI